MRVSCSKIFSENFRNFCGELAVLSRRCSIWECSVTLGGQGLDGRKLEKKLIIEKWFWSPTTRTQAPQSYFESVCVWGGGGGGGEGGRLNALPTPPPRRTQAHHVCHYFVLIKASSDYFPIQLGFYSNMADAEQSIGPSVTPRCPGIQGQQSNTRL